MAEKRHSPGFEVAGFSNTYRKDASVMAFLLRHMY